MRRIAAPARLTAFSALGRAVWDETIFPRCPNLGLSLLSVLSVEPYGMKLREPSDCVKIKSPFSALGRAVWDETVTARQWFCGSRRTFSALGRAVWDETKIDA